MLAKTGSALLEHNRVGAIIQQNFLSARRARSISSQNKKYSSTRNPITSRKSHETNKLAALKIPEVGTCSIARQQWRGFRDPFVPVPSRLRSLLHASALDRDRVVR
jgi:hypothetical protein